jgi:hypothetical protein
MFFVLAQSAIQAPSVKRTSMNVLPILVRMEARVLTLWVDLHVPGKFTFLLSLSAFRCSIAPSAFMSVLLVIPISCVKRTSMNARPILAQLARFVSTMLTLIPVEVFLC